MKGAIEELAALAEALVFEQREEERALAAIVGQQSLRVRKSEGVTWSPVTIQQQDFTFGGRVRLELVKGANGGQDGAFRSGTPVHVYQANEAGQPVDSTGVRRGIVRRAQQDKLEVIIDGDPLESSELHERWTVDIRSDDRTYRRMAEALSHWINSEDEHERNFRDAVLGLRQPDLASAPFSPESPSEVANAALNSEQREWISRAIAGRPLCILHGPPGTGKTTTLLGFIELSAMRGEKLLVCAPSNAAVDLLVHGCAQRKISVVRLGHPVRLDATVLPWGLDAQVEHDPEYKQVKDLRKRADAARKAANRFHRSFGPEERAARQENRREARALEAEATATEGYIAERVLRQRAVVCSTLVGAADSMLNGCDFDWVIVDEAAQALQPAVWIALRRSRRAILAGDPHQLPPVVKSSEALKRGLEISFLERTMASDSFMLTTQYRMHPHIMELSSRAFYNGRLRAAASVAAHACEVPALLFIDTAGCGFEETRTPGSESTSNPDEARFVIERLRDILESHAGMTVGVIAPYRAQAECLMHELLPFWKDFERLQCTVDCATVDSFQGQERDMIFISLTRSNEQASLGFLREYRRMNVAMTRAKHHLVVVGDGATIGQDPYYQSLLEFCESQGCYRSAWEWYRD